MILDSEKHREMLLALINASQVSGRLIEDIYELKKAVMDAYISAALPITTEEDLIGVPESAD